MSESEGAGDVRVNDRRRSDPEGNPRPVTEEAEVQRADAPSSDQKVEEAPPGSRAEWEQMKQNLEAAYRRIDDLARAVQAGEREREDFKKRLTRERERMIDVEKGNVAQLLLESIDELDLCMGSGDDSPLAKGVRMIRDNMVGRLSSLGVERVELVGRPFDPNLAEAVDMEITTSPDEDQKVLQEMRPAYRFKDRVIREGRVKVARYMPPAQA